MNLSRVFAWFHVQLEVTERNELADPVPIPVASSVVIQVTFRGSSLSRIMELIRISWDLTWPDSPWPQPHPHHSSLVWAEHHDFHIWHSPSISHHSVGGGTTFKTGCTRCTHEFCDGENQNGWYQIYCGTRLVRCRPSPSKMKLLNMHLNSTSMESQASVCL